MSDSEMAEYIAKIRQEVSEWPEWKKNLLADSVNPYWRDGKRPMSDDQMQDKSDYYLVIGPIEKNCGGYTAEDRKEWLEASWCGVSIEWIGTDKSIDYQRGYEAGRQAERDRIRALLKQSIVGPMFDIARKVEDATDGRWDWLEKIEMKGNQ